MARSIRARGRTGGGRSPRTGCPSGIARVRSSPRARRTMLPWTMLRAGESGKQRAPPRRGCCLPVGIFSFCQLALKLLGTFNEVTTLTCRCSSPPPNMFKTASELVSGDADAPEDNTDSDTLVDAAHYRDASPLLQGLLFFEGRAVFPQVLSKLKELDLLGVSMLSRSCRACKQVIKDHLGRKVQDYILRRLC